MKFLETLRCGGIEQTLEFEGELEEVSSLYAQAKIVIGWETPAVADNAEDALENIKRVLRETSSSKTTIKETA